MGNSVFGWLADNDGCGYYRIMQPLQELQRLGYKAKASSSFQPSEFTEFDTIVAQRTCVLGPSTVIEKLHQAKRNHLVFEVDDDLLRVDRSNEKCYHVYTHPEIVENFERNASLANLVTVTNEVLANVMRKYNPNVAVIPNFIEEKYIDMPSLDIIANQGTPEEFNLSETMRENNFVSVAYQGSETHRKDFELIRDQLILLNDKNPKLRYIFQGARYDIPHVHIPWISNDMQRYYQHINYDIGIAPLASTNFNNSKSYIKALEYAARGIPIVASDEPPYHDFVKHGETGFLFKHPYQFKKYVQQLIDDEAMRKEMGAKAKEYSRNFTIEKNIGLYIDAYKLEKK